MTTEVYSEFSRMTMCFLAICLSALPILCIAQSTDGGATVLCRQDLGRQVLYVTLKQIPVEPYAEQISKDFPNAPQPQKAQEYRFTLSGGSKSEAELIHSIVELEYDQANEPKRESRLRILTAKEAGPYTIVVFKDKQLTCGLVIEDGKTVIPMPTKAESGEIMERDTEMNGPITSARIIDNDTSNIRVELTRTKSSSILNVTLGKVDGRYIWQRTGVEK